MSTIPTNRESDRFMLRLPDGMRDRIKAAAEANNRSMNAEIVASLERAYPIIDPLQVALDQIDSRIEAFRARSVPEGRNALAAISPDERELGILIRERKLLGEMIADRKSPRRL